MDSSTHSTALLIGHLGILVGILKLGKNLFVQPRYLIVMDVLGICLTKQTLLIGIFTKSLLGVHPASLRIQFNTVALKKFLLPIRAGSVSHFLTFSGIAVINTCNKCMAYFLTFKLIYIFLIPLDIILQAVFTDERSLSGHRRNLFTILSPLAIGIVLPAFYKALAHCIFIYIAFHGLLHTLLVLSNMAVDCRRHFAAVHLGSLLFRHPCFNHIQLLCSRFKGLGVFFSLIIGHGFIPRYAMSSKFCLLVKINMPALKHHGFSTQINLIIAFGYLFSAVTVSHLSKLLFSYIGRNSFTQRRTIKCILCLVVADLCSTVIKLILSPFCL